MSIGTEHFHQGCSFFVSIAGGNSFPEEVCGEPGKLVIDVGLLCLSQKEFDSLRTDLEGTFGVFIGISGNGISTVFHHCPNGRGGVGNHGTQGRYLKTFGFQETNTMKEAQHRTEEIGEKREINSGCRPDRFPQIDDVSSQALQKRLTSLKRRLCTRNKHGGIRFAYLDWSSRDGSIEIINTSCSCPCFTFSGLPRAACAQLNQDPTSQGSNDLFRFQYAVRGLVVGNAHDHDRARACRRCHILRKGRPRLNQWYSLRAGSIPDGDTMAMLKQCTRKRYTHLS